MPAYARQENGALLVTFSREAEDADQRVAGDGVKAVTLAMRMLAAREELRPDDALAVRANRPLPAPVTPSRRRTAQ